MTARVSDFRYPAGQAIGRRISTMVALGDSTAVGIGDRVRGGWRGFGPLLADALRDPGPQREGEALRYANLSLAGARIHDVRHHQLPVALPMRPDAAVIMAGMNDTLRSDFNPDQLHDDLDTVIGALTAAGSVVVTAKYHDHSKVFRLPAPLARALTRRIAELNEILDTVVTRYGARCLDLADIPGAYDLPAWSVDRLHPSELGHRLLARGFGELLTDAGCVVPRPVTLECSGGRRPSAAEHVLWLLIKGLPWLWRRSSDLLPYAARIWWRDRRGLDPLAPRTLSVVRDVPAQPPVLAGPAEETAAP